MRILFVFVVLASVAAFADTLHVPGGYATIQEAIDAAANGDTVLVAPGTYLENLDFLGKAIAVVGSAGPGATVVDGGQKGCVVTFENGEGPDSLLEGFTLTNGSGKEVHTPWNILLEGGGVFCSQSSPTLKGNTITWNTAHMGGGLFFGGSCPVMRENTISYNKAGTGGGVAFYSDSDGVVEWNLITGNIATTGGGLFMQNSSPEVSNNIVAQNAAQSTQVGYGGGLYCDSDCYSKIHGNAILGNTAVTQSGGMEIWGNVKLLSNVIAGNSAPVGGGICLLDGDPTLSNCTFFDNTAQLNGGALCCLCEFSSSPLYAVVKNSIFWSNDAPSGPQIWLGTDPPASPGELMISHCDVEGGQDDVYVEPGCILHWGPGMIDADPLFMNPLNVDFRLQQDPCQPGVVNPCVDSGGNQAWNYGLHENWTRTDGVPDAGVMDMGIHYGPSSFPKLYLFDHEISATAGGYLIFELYGGEENAGRYYVLLGSLSGTSPGTPMPGGMVVLPLNFDVLTSFILSNLNVIPFHQFLKPLSSEGRGAAYLYTNPMPSVVGLTADFAYPLSNPFDFVSNPVTLEFVP